MIRTRIAYPCNLRWDAKGLHIESWTAPAFRLHRIDNETLRQLFTAETRETVPMADAVRMMARCFRVGGRDLKLVPGSYDRWSMNHLFAPAFLPSWLFWTAAFHFGAVASLLSRRTLKILEQCGCYRGRALGEMPTWRGFARGLKPGRSAPTTSR